MDHALNRNIYPIFIICLAVTGIWCSDGLLRLHDSVARGTSDSKPAFLMSWCSASVSGISGCESTANSPWSEISIRPLPGTTPVAFLGWAYFCFFAIWFAFNGSTRFASRPQRWLLIAIGLGGIYASIFFISLMAFGRAAWCPVCVACHGVNALMLAVLAWDLSRPKQTDAASDATGNIGLPLYRTAASLLFVVVIVGLVDRGRNSAIEARETSIDLAAARTMVESARAHVAVLLAAYQAEPVQTVPIASGDLSPTAAHRLVVFTDMECPACAAADITLHEKIEPAFLRAHAELHVETRHFPLCTDCNSSTPKNIHPNACEAAKAAEAARQLGGSTAFDAMTRALHAHRDELGPQLYVDLAAAIKLPPTAFVSAMSGPAIRDAIARDIKLGNDLGVKNTPTMFLDGRRVPELCMTPDFWKAIAEMPIDRPHTPPTTGP